MSHKQVYMAANKLLESLNDLYLIYNKIQVLNCCEKIQFSIKISICNALKQGGYLVLKCFFKADITEFSFSHDIELADKPFSKLFHFIIFNIQYSLENVVDCIFTVKTSDNAEKIHFFNCKIH